MFNFDKIAFFHLTETLSLSEPAAKPAKRKAESKKETPPAKKAKSDGDGKEKFTDA